MNRGLLATEAELARLGERVGRKPFDHIYETLRKRCALILECSPITETMWRSAHQQGRWGAATAAVGSIQGRIFDLVISHRIEPNTAYRDRAVEELKGLLSFSSWVDPVHSDMHADLCTGEACATAAIALDWLADELTEADRLRCVRAVREKGLQPYLKAVKAGAFWHSCYHNWNAVINGATGIAALLLADDEDAAASALAKVRAGLENFFNALGREGGWDEGLGYWGYAMRYVLLFGEALARTGNDAAIFRHRGMDTTGLFPVYFTPHGMPVSFGDWPITPAWGVFYLLARRFGLKEVVWWLDRYAFRQDVATTGYSDAGLALLFRPTDWRAKPAPDLRAVKAFNEIGWVALADRLPDPGLYAALKTGDLSAHHAQLDMNSVQLAVDGEILLHDLGSPEFTREYLSPEGRHEFYEVRSASHNTITVGGRDHRIDAIGTLVEAQEAPTYRWAAGDAGEALGEAVRFVRHVVMPVTEVTKAGAMIVVVDEVHNVTAEEIVLTWHSGGEVAARAGGKSGTITGRLAAAKFALAASVPFKATVTRRKLGKRRTDHTIKVRAKAAEAIFVSVFAPGPLGKVKLTCSARGEVSLKIGRLDLQFRPRRRSLRLERVEQG